MTCSISVSYTHLASQTLKADPGAFSVYCNDGFTLLELLIEKVSGMPFSKYLKETFFTPMGLEHTSTTADTFDEAQLAKTYLPDVYKRQTETIVGSYSTSVSTTNPLSSRLP